MKDAGKLKGLVDAVKELISEAQFQCSARGMHMDAMDSAHCALVSMDLPAEDFVEYWCDVPMVVGISLLHFSKVLKMAQEGDELFFCVMGDTAQLRLGTRVEFELRLMTIDVDTFRIPTTTALLTASVPSKEFKTTIMELKDLGDNVTFAVKEGKLALSFVGDLGSGTVHFSPDHVYTSGAETPFRYAMRFLIEFARAAALDPTTWVDVREDGTLGVLCGSVQFYLAPKMPEE